MEFRAFVRTFLPVSALLLASLVAASAHGQDDPPPEDEKPAVAPGKVKPLPGAPIRPQSGLPLPPALQNGVGAPLPGPDGAPAVDGGLKGPPPPDDPPDAAEDKPEPPEDEAASASTVPGASLAGSDRNKPPCLDPQARVKIDFVDVELVDLIKFFAEITCKNFILTEDIRGKVTIISHTEVTVPSAYEAFLAALASAGYTVVEVGNTNKVVPTSKAAQNPVKVYEGDAVSSTSGYVTQIFTLSNVTVNDIASVARDLAGPEAKIIAYAPTNTLIITDSAVNIRRMWKVVSQLDVAAPRSQLKTIQLENAAAADVKRIIEEVYGTAESSGSSSSSSASTAGTAADRAAAARRRRRTEEAAPAPSEASATSIGSEGSYIQKIVADERTNSLILLANEEALEAVMALIAELDRDVDPASRSQIHVYYLEHAKAEEVAQVLSNLSQDAKTGSNSRTNNRATTTTPSRTRTPTPAGGKPGDEGGVAGADGFSGAAALLDDTVRVTSDENTNSLVIIASPDAYQIIEGVIKKLDIRRKQVFVEVVIMELASEDTMDLGVAAHVGKPGDLGGLTLGSAQLGASSLGLSSDLLSGMAMGVFGEAIDVAISDGAGGTTTLSVPAFGIALNALQANSSVNILSTPNVLTMDNEEAKIIVGRNIPFPISSGRDSNNNPIISYQREDVAITLQVTPQINESDYVTLEIFQEVTEIEEDSQGLDVTSAGFITSKRSAETTVLVKDNQTVVIGGLMGQTDTQVETKVPLLGDLPVIGVLFRGRREVSRKTNLLIFLTPHVIDEPADLEEVYRVKVAQRQEFLRRFYGKSAEEQVNELNELLRYSMNIVDEPSMYRSKTSVDEAALAPPAEGGVGTEDWTIEEVYPPEEEGAEAGEPAEAPVEPDPAGGAP